jgi:PilZ domain
MVNTRIAPRHRVSKAAKIEFLDSTISCVVRDLSLTGAAIEASVRSGIPERFTLIMPDDGLRLSCRVAWRREYRMGVAFE